MSAEFKRDIPFAEYKQKFFKQPKELFTTSSETLNMGMCRCSDCGRLTDVDYKFCKHCDQQILIIHEKRSSNTI